MGKKVQLKIDIPLSGRSKHQLIREYFNLLTYERSIQFPCINKVDVSSQEDSVGEFCCAKSFFFNDAVRIYEQSNTAHIN